MILRTSIAPVCLLLLTGFLATRLHAEPPRVLPEGDTPKDRRLGPLTDLNGYFPFRVSETPEQWSARAAHLRRQLRVALGLWPMPAKTAANAVVHGKVVRDDYTVERVYFESFPGHFVTGSLYRPKGAVRGRRPGVLCPHGHWSGGRFFEAGEAAVRAAIESGGERFERGGRSHLQARCVHLARMGCVVFHYDMLGYADSVQLGHRPGIRDAMNTAENWGYFSPQAELRLQTMMGLQTYNSVRALDWLSSLDDVDPERIGVTGASGGGTQTFVLCAIDPRPAAAFPAVMVSTAMQGGCTCENAPYLRVGTGNVEIAALFSPRPLALTAAADWTREMETKGFPELRRHYAMLEAADHVALTAALQFGHNYNQVSRAAMYAWFNEHLKLRQKGPVEERDFAPLSAAEMTVWGDAHPKPPAGDDYERSLLRTITRDSEARLAALSPRDGETLDEFRRVVGGAWEVLIGRGVPKSEDVAWEKLGEHDRGDHLEFTGLLRNTSHGEELPVVFLYPKREWNKQVVLWVSGQGKAGLYGSDGALRPAVGKLLAEGASVAGLDLLFQGEFLADGKPVERARLNESGRGSWKTYAGYTYGYNQSLFAQRTSDILTLIAFVRSQEEAEEQPQAVHLVGTAGAGPWAAAARAIAGKAVNRAAIDSGGFRFAALTAIDDVNFLPGAVKYGDLPALLALCTPHPLWVTGEKQLPEIIGKAYESAGATGNVSLFRGKTTERELAAAKWLLE